MSAQRGGVPSGAELEKRPGRSRADQERAAASFDALYEAPETVQWMARESSSSDEVQPRDPKPAKGSLAFYEQLAARAMERAAAASCNALSSESSAGAPSSDVCADLRPPAIDTPPSSANPLADPRRPLSRKQWHKRELARIRLEESSERNRAAKQDKRARLVKPDNQAANSNAGELEIWSSGRTRRAVEARAKVRPLIDGRVSAARARWRELAEHAETAHFAIGIKRLCDAQGWTMADLSARRALTMLEYFRELAIPTCWNARYARKPRRGMGVFGDVLKQAARKYTPCVRANARPFLATVIAWPGHSPEDSRPVNDKTVTRVSALLEAYKLIQKVQVPAHAAEAFELGDSGHAINRYWLADRGTPKPALLGCWNPAGELLWSDVLDTPWSAATPHAADTPPPDPV